MTPSEAARITWEEDPRLLTPEAAAAIAAILPGGDAEEGREAA